jgi:tRNA G18 (ribose-2'-O)-methylase SpoU
VDGDRTDEHDGGPGSHVEIVVDLDDPRIAPYRGMRDPVIRRELGCFVAEGPDIASQCVALGLEIISALIDARQHAPVLPMSTPVLAADPTLIRHITGLGVHRGVLALVRRPTERVATEVLGGARRIAICEGVENPVNVGLIVRSAAGLGIDALLLDPTSADPLYRRALTASRGAALHLPWARIGDLPGALPPGYTTVAMTPDPGADDLRALTFGDSERVALLLGSEGPGLTDATMTAADVRARLPLRPLVDSLNVATAAALAFWELTR